MSAPVVKAWAWRSRAAWAEAAPVWTRTPPRSTPRLCSKRSRAAPGNGAPEEPDTLSRAAAGSTGPEPAARRASRAVREVLPTARSAALSVVGASGRRLMRRMGG
jgi:hypothetical protein